VEAAVLKASPLPYAGFEAVFSRTLELNFIAEPR
jgi:colicin import membrane protein